MDAFRVSFEGEIHPCVYCWETSYLIRWEQRQKGWVRAENMTKESYFRGLKCLQALLFLLNWMRLPINCPRKLIKP